MPRMCIFADEPDRRGEPGGSRRGLRRWQHRGFVGSEAAGFVGAIAEGAVCGLAAAAEGDGRLAGGEIEFLTARVDEAEWAFDYEWAVGA